MTEGYLTGEQLNQEDLSVWETLVHLARTHPLGNVCQFTAYGLRLNPTLIRLYGETQWTALNWPHRLKLRRKPLALALHGYYSTHVRPVPVKLSTLQSYTGSANAQPADFKRKATKALEELKALGFLSSYYFERDLVIVLRA